MKALRLRNILSILSISVFLCCSAAMAEDSSSYKTQALNDGGGSSGGDTPLPDLFTGNMSYRVPIQVPVGRGGMDPGIALLYRSGNGNGWIGMGWELEVGAIERSTKGGVDYNGNKYLSRMAGATTELIDISGNGTEFRAKIEGAFNRFIKQAGYWVVTDKKGTRYYFGQIDDSRQYNTDIPDTSKVFKWCLDKVEDTNGNIMTMTYFKNQGQIYLDQIDYPVNNYIKFHREERTDVPTMYTTNFGVKTAYRLKTIEVVANNTKKVRAYKLVYDTDLNTTVADYSPNTGRSILTGVKEYGKDYGLTDGTVTGGTELPELGFKQPALNSFDTTPHNSIRLNSMESWNMQGDFNGDGMTDIMAVWSTTSGSVYVNYATAAGFREESYNGLAINDDPAWNMLGDFNGDGKTDIMAVWSTGSGNAYVNYSTGSGFIREQVPYTGLKINDNKAWNMLGDFNGDGKTDMLAVWSTTSGTVYVNYANSNGNGFTLESYTDLKINDNRAWNMLGDFNGDGKMDILAVWSTTSGDVYVNYGRDSGFVREQLPYSGLAINSDPSWNMLGDFNGDGKTDIMAVWSTTSGNVYVNYATGTGFRVEQVPYTGLKINDNKTWNMLGDFNGDGKTDMLAVWSTGSGIIYVNYSTGTGFRLESYSSLKINDNRIWNMLGDYNGDGKMDMVAVWSATYDGMVYKNLSAISPDLLTTIQNGLGGTTTITYKPSTQYEGVIHPRLPFPVQTVYQVNVNDGNNNVSETTYKYEGGYFYSPDKDFRGFNKVTVTGPAGTDGEKSVTETWFHQGNDTAVDANNPETATGYMKGKPYRVTVKDGSGKIYTETTTSYATNTSILGNYYNPAYETNTYLYDGNSTYGKQTRTTYVQDNYGNVTAEYRSGDLSDTTDDYTITRSYTTDAGSMASWIIGKPTNETIYQGSTKKSETNYYYDGTDTCNTPSIYQSNIAKGNLTRVTGWLKDSERPAGVPAVLETTIETKMEYDTYGNLSCSKDPNGNKTTIEYDPATHTYPRIVRKYFPDGTDLHTETKYYGVDGEDAGPTALGLYGQIKSTIDPNGAATTYEYDQTGRKTKTTAPDNSYATISYNSFGNGIGTQNIQTSNSAGLTSWSYFDGLGRTIKQESTGPDGKTVITQQEYDQRGAVKKSYIPRFSGETSGYTTSFYDPIGRVKSVQMPDLTTTQACYNNGITVTIDANNHKKRTVKDVYGRLIETNEYTGSHTTCDTDLDSLHLYSTTTYTYDVTGNLIYVTDAKLNQTEIRYDTLGRKTYMKDPDMGIWNYYYDNNGNLTSQIDAMGQSIHFQYDAMNRLIQKDYDNLKALGSGDIVYRYDETHTQYGKGRLTSIKDKSIFGLYTYNSRYHYNSLGQTIQYDKVIDGVNYTTQYGYDQAGRPETITYPDPAATIIHYTYNGPYLSSVWEYNQPAYAEYANHNALGQPGTIAYGNGVTTGYTYNTPGNTLCPQDNNRLCSIYTSKNGITYQDMSYQYDNVGNITLITDNTDNNQTHETDKLTRLNGLNTTSYGYPQSGTNSIQPHAVTTADGNTYTYDNNGNMRTGAGRTITYTPENMPQTINNGTETTFTYDGNGSRVKKTTGANTTVYINGLYECTGGECVKYIYAGGQRIARKSATATLYFHPDHLGGSSIITDQSGNEVEYIAYYPFGQTRIDSGSENVRYKYTDQELDSETGLYNYGARIYDPQLGRFITADSIIPDPGDPQSFNRYSGMLNNPIRYTDPTGHWSFDIGDWQVSGDDFTTGAVISVFSPVAGAPFLYQSEQGRNILAAEIMVATAAATWYCGGCGAGYGAFAGELVGGYSAHKSGGDVLSGVIVGGIVGGTTGYLGAQAGEYTLAQLGETKLGYIASGAAQGSILGAGSGGVAGYAGGAGNWNSITTGIWQGAVIGGAIGGGLGYAKYSLRGEKMISDYDLSDVQSKLKSAWDNGLQKTGNMTNATAQDLGNNVLSEIGSEFGRPALNSFVNTNYAAFGSLSVSVGIEVTDHSISRAIFGQGISGGHKWEF